MKISEVGEVLTPTKSEVSNVTSQAVSFPSEVSGIDDDEGVGTMGTMEFYRTVTREREALQKKKGRKAFKWTLLKEELDKCNSYFKRKTYKQVRDRYKYVKNQLLDIA